jgi:hypothetical protein
VQLQIEAGPGELPTGRHIAFTPGGDIPIRDGQAAIAMRSWQRGVSRLRATSPGLQDATLDVPTLDGPPFKPGVTPLVADRPYRPLQPAVDAASQEQVFGRDNPTDASSSAPGHLSRLVNDGDAATYWAPAAGDLHPWVSIDLERIVTVHRLIVTLPSPGRYAIRAEVETTDGQWKVLTDQAMHDITQATVELPADLQADSQADSHAGSQADSPTGRKVRLSVRSATGEPAGIAEIRVAGKLNNR